MYGMDHKFKLNKCGVVILLALMAGVKHKLTTVSPFPLLDQCSNVSLLLQIAKR